MFWTLHAALSKCDLLSCVRRNGDELCWEATRQGIVWAGNSSRLLRSTVCRYRPNHWFLITIPRIPGSRNARSVNCRTRSGINETISDSRSEFPMLPVEISSSLVACRNAGACRQNQGLLCSGFSARSQQFWRSLDQSNDSQRADRVCGLHRIPRAQTSPPCYAANGRQSEPSLVHRLHPPRLRKPCGRGEHSQQIFSLKVHVIHKDFFNRHP